MLGRALEGGVSCFVFWFRVSCFVFLGFGFRISGFGFRVSGFGFRVSGFGLRVSGFGFRVSGSGSRFSVFGFRVSVFGFRVSGFGGTVADAEADGLRECQEVTEPQCGPACQVFQKGLSDSNVVARVQISEPRDNLRINCRDNLRIKCRQAN